MLRPAFRQKPVRETALIGNARISIACRAFGISDACYRFASKLDEENELIRRRLHELTAENLTWGFETCFLYLRNVESRDLNHNRVYRICCEKGLNQSAHQASSLSQARQADKLSIPSSPCAKRSMDFMQDNLQDCRMLRCQDVIDDFNRECLGIECDLTLPSLRVILALYPMFERRCVPQLIKIDNGPDFSYSMMRDCAPSHGIALNFIEPDNPQHNAYIERFNGTCRWE